MAPVPFQHQVRYAPLALVATHITSVIYLTYAVGSSLYTSYKSLGPAQDTRSRLAQRKRLAPIFVGLAIAAISLSAYSAATVAKLSYNTWAYEHGLDLHSLVPGEDVFPSAAGGSGKYYIKQWLSDVPIYRDVLEIVAESARRFWWGQQVSSATMAFAMFLAIEGRRRKIPLLSAFMALAHLVSLSYAQSLFYLALLLTPAPLRSGDGDLKLPVVPLPTSRWTQLRNKLLSPKPEGWVPNLWVFLSALGLNFASTLMLPYAAGTSSFMKFVLLARASTFLPLLLPKLLPASCGTVHAHPHGAYASFTKLFHWISATSFAQHAKATLTALAYNTPSAHYHRHSALLPWDVEQRSRWERSTTALAKVLGSIADHPVVAAIGWDALLCALGLGLWAAVRAIDARDVIGAAVALPPSGFGGATSAPAPASEEEEAESEQAAPDEHDDESEHSQPPPRRRGRPSKNTTTATAATTGKAKGSRRRGRPASVRNSATPNRQQKNNVEDGEEADEYKPTPAEARSAAPGDVVVVADRPDWEAAALVWGLAALGGLASAAAGVFGAECVSR
ncbi:hypothetical protein GGR56DRAFT_629338 [Xylariaceae sp. FL0804]|nr:hypothetical protein GGR56DRAFT_629338 [Xylariaceae sp. FL0804]